MFYDVLTLAAVRDELQQKILDGRVQRVLRLSEHSLGCEIYASHERHWLLLSAHPQHARVHLAGERLARGAEDVTPLLLLLRKHVRDARLVAIDQPPLERVLVLTFSKQADDPAAGFARCQLIIEVMGRYSNIILADEQDVILDSLKRVPAQLSRYRVVLPKHPYLPPPPQNKTPPSALDDALLDRALRAQRPDALIWQGLVATIAGMSPLLAREIVFRALGEVSATVALLTTPALVSRLRETTLDLYRGLADHGWQPSIIRENGSVVAFAPYLLTHLGSPERCEGMSAAIDTYYAELEQLTSGEQQKNQLRPKLEEVRQRHLRRKEALERQLSQGQAAERLRQSGEAILAAISSIRPGQQRLEADGQVIDLEPRLSAVENAQAYFREYKKAKGALEQVPDLLAVEETTLAYLDEVAAHLELAETAEEVRRVAADLREAGLTGAPQPAAPEKKKKAAQRGARQRKREERQGPPPFRVLAGGYEVYVGRSARQNEEVTFKTAGPDDLWLHARGVPGAHVVVKARGRPLPEAVVHAAARLAATFSQARHSDSVAVDYTLRKHVRRVRAGLPGLVTYSEERTVHVAPERGGGL